MKLIRVESCRDCPHQQIGYIEVFVTGRRTVYQIPGKWCAVTLAEIGRAVSENKIFPGCKLTDEEPKK